MKRSQLKSLVEQIAKIALNESMTTRAELDAGTMKAVNLEEGMYSPVTLQMNRMGHIHVWKGKVVPQQTAKYNYVAGGRESEVYFQVDTDIQEVLNILTSDEKHALENGWPVVTTNLSDEYFAGTDHFNKLEEVKNLSVPEKHQLRIALQTLKMTDAGANIMGGMDKEEARNFLRKKGFSDQQIRKLEDGPTKNNLQELGGPPTNMGFVKGALRQAKGNKQKAIEFLDKMSIKAHQNKAEQLSGDYSRAATFLEKNPSYELTEMSTSSGAGSYNTPFAFSKNKDGSSRAIASAKKYGTVVKSISEKI